MIDAKVLLALKSNATKKGAVGPDRLSVGVWKVLRNEGLSWFSQLFNQIAEGDPMLDEQRERRVVFICKKKGDVQSCKNFRGNQIDKPYHEAVGGRG